MNTAGRSVNSSAVEWWMNYLLLPSAIVFVEIGNLSIITVDRAEQNTVSFEQSVVKELTNILERQFYITIVQ